MTAPRAFDVILLGRTTLELRAQQHGARLEQATSFTREVGGAAAATAFGCARLGMRTALVSRVGDDAAGRFVVDALAAAGCDVSRVALDRERATAMALVGDEDRGSARSLRSDSADLAIDDDAVDEAFIASARALVVTGGYFATERTERVSLQAVEHARRHDVRTVLDIDGGAEIWARGASAAQRLHPLLGRFDLIVGTEAEIRIAGGDDDLKRAALAIRRMTQATIVVKQGRAVCTYVDGDPTRHAFDPVAFAHTDASDAFLAGLLQGWLAGLSGREASRRAWTCGYIVLARHGGISAMPSAAELDYERANDVLVTDPRFARVRRATLRRRSWDDVCVIAIDDRVQAFELTREAGALYQRTAQLKQLLVRAVAEAADSLRGPVGLLVDDEYGGAALASAGRGWWIARPVEVPGSLPLEFEAGRSIGTRLVTWPSDHIVKCRVQFHPDAPVDERLEQETQLGALHAAILASGHELLLEVVLPRSLPSTEDTIERAIKRLYNIGIFPEWWSLEAMPADTWHKVDMLIAERDPRCRGVLALDPGDLAAPAAARSCRGIVVGSTAFRAASLAWLSGAIDDATLIAQARAVFEARASAWRQARGAKAAK